MIPLKEAKGHLKRASTSHKRECGKRYGTRVLCVRNPRSTLSAGKPRTWGRGNLRNQATFQSGEKHYKVLQVLIEREGKKPLVARWGAISLHWDIKAPIKDHRIFLGPGRSELERRLLADTCEYCGTTGDAERIEVHHIRALKDLKSYDGREKPAWVKIMAARKRKTLVLCATCHQDVTYGRPMRRKPMSVSRKR